MNRLFNKTTISFGAFGVTLLVVIAAAIFVFSGVTHADNGKQSGNGRILTIHDREIEKTVVSQAATIRDALRDAGISIGDKDVVEPSLDQKMITSDYQVNIYRARPVIIIDGIMRTKIITAYQTPEQIAAEAGIRLFDEDQATLSRNDDIVADGAGLKLTIKRAMSFTFTLYGKVMTARTFSKTVAEMLTEKGIKLTSSDKVTPELNTTISEGLAVRVWREGKDVINVDEVINFDTDTIEDVDQPVGYSAIKTAGVLGNRSVSYEITIQDSIEVSRNEIASIVTKQPKKQIIVIGVKGKYNTPTENENITWDYLISKGFNRIQTAGIMGNLKQENKFYTDGDGLAQWTGSRKDKLVSMYGDNYQNIYNQLDFLMMELDGGYSGVKNNIRKSTSLQDVVWLFQSGFEGCGDCRNDLRNSYASNILASH